VHIWPCLDALGHAATIIELSSPDGEAHIQARTDELYEFLAESETLVRSGTEGDHVDVEAAVASLLT
jgi:predicted exporter